ncbi:MAG: hypothetical protein IK111_03045 [Lachnospiraceae bacterium]|nr:hypothetical protein [Lachnospiraceae bacterium]
MEQKIRCRTCAAEYDASLVRCPFCGTAYALAEEKEYMGKLEEVREELHQQTVKGDKRIKKGMSATVRVILAAVVVAVLLLFGILWLSGRSERSRSDQKKEEFLQNQGITTQQEVTDR